MPTPLPLTIREAADSLEAHDLTSEQLTRVCLDRIAESQDRLNAFALVTEDLALEAALASDQRREHGDPLGLLDGIPIAVKDLFDLAGFPTAGGCRAYAEDVASTDSNVCRRLKEAGAVIVGKTTTPELACGFETTSDLYGVTTNPWGHNLSPRGSSGGSAVAVAAGLAIGAIGTDTGGSVRGPAAWCGVLGYVPSFGLIGRSGMHHFSTSLDHVGFYGRSVDDVAIQFEALVGEDPADPDSQSPSANRSSKRVLPSPLELRIGVIRSVVESADQEVRSAFEISLSHLRELGAELSDIEPFEGIELKHPIVNPEFAAQHGARFQRTPDLFGKRARRYIELGSKVKELTYREGLEQRASLQREVENRLGDVDALVCPTSLTTPRSLEEDTRAKEDANVTIPFNIARLSMAAVPNGLSEGLPTSLLIGAHNGRDDIVLMVARALQRVTDHHLNLPPAW